MAADPITAIGNAISGLFGTIKPVVEEHYAQKYENEHKDRMQELSDIMAGVDSAHRANSLGDFARRLCNDAGTPITSLSGELIEIPVEYFQAFLVNVSESIRDSQKLARLSFKTS